MLGFRQLSSQYTHTTCKLLINNVNVFGISPQLTVTKAKQYNTFVGFIFTLILTISIVALILTDLSEVFRRQRPEIIYSEKILNDLMEFPLTSQNFTLAISIYNKNYEPIDNLYKYFSVTFQFCRISKGIASLNCTQTQAIPCQQEHLNQEYQQKYFFNLKSMFCLPTNNQSLQGVFTSNNYSYLNIVLQSCNDQECGNAIQDSYYVVHMTNTLLQWDNMVNLTEKVVKSSFHKISLNYTRTISQQYKIIEKNVDTAYISTTRSTQYRLSLQDPKETCEYRNENVLITHQIHLDAKVICYNLTYTKLSTFFSLVGGYIIFIYLLLKTVLSPINKILYQIYLTNKIFRFQQCNVKEQQVDQVEQNVKQSAYFQNIESPNSYCWANVNENLLLQNQQIFNYLRRVKKTIELTSKELMLLIVGCKKKYNQKIQIAEQKLNQQIDIVHILMKLQELERLKYLLLDSDQLNLFNTLSKIYLEKEQNNQDGDTQMDKLQKGFKSYVNLQVKQQKGPTDLKLMELLDVEEITLFEQLYRDLTFKSFFKDIALKESKTLKIKPQGSFEESPYMQKQGTQKHVKLQTNADQ